MCASISRLCALCLLALWSAGAVHAGSVSLQGTLTLAPGDANDLFNYAFMLASPSTVSVQSYGYGGSAGAPGGKNLAGTTIPAGGFDPYVSVFLGTGPTSAFIASNDDGACPPGITDIGLCVDSSLTLILAPGTYTVVLSAFKNMSLAENYGSGTLGDGFVDLGIFDSARSNAYAIDINVSPVSVQSRKSHGAAGDFDLAIDLTQPITGAVTIEPRAIGGGHILVYQFNTPIVSSGTVTAVDGVGLNLSPVTAIPAGNTVLVTLPVLPDNSRARVLLTGINGSPNFVPASVGFLVGDVNGDRSVTSTDIPAVKARSGQPTNSMNFKYDLTTSGAITAADVSTVKARIGNNLW